MPVWNTMVGDPWRLDGDGVGVVCVSVSVRFMSQAHSTTPMTNKKIEAKVSLIADNLLSKVPNQDGSCPVTSESFASFRG